MKGSQNNKVGAPDFPRRLLADKFLYMALIRINAYKCAKFQLPSCISFRDKEGVPKFNVGLLAPCSTRTLKLYVCSKYLARSNSLPNFSIVSLCIMQLCEYVFPIGFPFVPKNGVLGDFEGECVKLLCSDPWKLGPIGQIFTCSHSTCTCLPAYQISTF